MSAMALLLFPFSKARRVRGFRLLGLGLMLVTMSVFSGCSNSYYNTNLVATGTYQVPITATDANGNSQTATLTVVVTP